MKKRKQHKPKPVNPISGLHAILKRFDNDEMKKPLRSDKTMDLSLAYRLALQTMMTGDSREEDWSVCVTSLNVGLVLCEMGIGREYEALFNEALLGAFKSKLRAQRTGSWRFDGDALNAIKHAFTVHEEQIKFATQEEVILALQTVRNRIDEGLVYEEGA